MNDYTQHSKVYDIMNNWAIEAIDKDTPEVDSLMGEICGVNLETGEHTYSEVDVERTLKETKGDDVYVYMKDGMYFYVYVPEGFVDVILPDSNA